jgi:hypothetical protein
MAYKENLIELHKLISPKLSFLQFMRNFRKFWLESTYQHNLIRFADVTLSSIKHLKTFKGKKK